MKKVVVFFMEFYLIAYSFSLCASQQNSGNFKSYKNEIKRVIEALGGSTEGLTDSQSPPSRSITSPYQEYIRFGVMRSGASLESAPSSSGDIAENQNPKDVIVLPHVIYDNASVNNNKVDFCQKKSTEIFQRSSSLKIVSESTGENSDSVKNYEG